MFNKLYFLVKLPLLNAYQAVENVCCSALDAGLLHSVPQMGR